MVRRRNSIYWTTSHGVHAIKEPSLPTDSNDTVPSSPLTETALCRQPNWQKRHCAIIPTDRNDTMPPSLLTERTLCHHHPHWQKRHRAIIPLTVTALCHHPYWQKRQLCHHPHWQKRHCATIPDRNDTVPSSPMTETALYHQPYWQKQHCATLHTYTDDNVQTTKRKYVTRKYKGKVGENVTFWSADAASTHASRYKQDNSNKHWHMRY
jgi:hypothetical protein